MLIVNGSLLREFTNALLKEIRTDFQIIPK
jgi:hypothetical protein